MNLFFFSKNFIKQVSLVGVAAWIGYPQIVNAEGMVVESGTMGAIQQSVEAKGVVYDATGFPVIGASVVEKGNSTNGVITDLDGNFTLQVAKNAVIVISYMGYQTQEVQVTPGKILNITLKEDNQVLDEVVVVGYGVQKKVNLTGSVATVEGETLEQRPLANATQSLQGMVPGLYIDNTNAGRPGATSSLQLRGQGNLSGNAAPYVLVDGLDFSDVVAGYGQCVRVCHLFQSGLRKCRHGETVQRRETGTVAAIHQRSYWTRSVGRTDSRTVDGGSFRKQCQRSG